METLYTDNEGKVDYNSNNADKDYMYYAEACKDKYFDTHNNQVSVTRGEKNFETTIFMYAESYVKLHVKNVHPFNQIDLITIDTYCQNLQYAYQLQGINIDTSFVWCIDCDCRWFGNYNYDAAFTFRKNNIDSTLLYHFIPIPNDTIILIVDF